MDKHAENEAQTAQIAAELAPSLKAGDIILLHGTLGMGKTVFARALVRALTGNGSEDVPSPTFTLVQTYDGQSCPVFHYDLYRIEDPEEIHELGWEDACAEGITIVEWPERLGAYRPAQTLDISISSVDNDPNARLIQIQKP